MRGRGRERERERERRGLLCNEDSRYAAARRSVSAFRLPQCALYSPTLKESHALTSSCRLLCASATEEDPKSAAETNQVRGHFTGRPLTRRFHAATGDHRETLPIHAGSRSGPGALRAAPASSPISGEIEFGGYSAPNEERQFFSRGHV